MSRQQLAETIELLHKFQEQDDSNQAKTVFEGRTLIWKILDGCLSDKKTIVDAEPLSNSGENSVCHTVLQWCHLRVLQNKEFFIPPTHASGDETPTLGHTRIDRSPHEELLSFAFTRWFLLKMIWLQSKSECESLHDTSRKITVELLQVIKWRDLYCFSQLLTDLIYTVAELVQVNENLFDGGPGKTLKRFHVEEEVVRKSLRDPDKAENETETDKVTTPSLDILTVEDCESLQLNFVRMLLALSEDLYLVGNPLHDIVWGAMCCHLEFYDLQMKIESLRVIEKLLLVGGLPQIHIQDYFLGCLGALVELVCSGCKGGDSSERLELEERTAQVILKVCLADGKPLAAAHLSDLQHQTLLNRTCTILEQQGTQQLLSVAMTMSLSDLLSHCLEALSSPGPQEGEARHVKDHAFSVLLQEVGRNTESGYLVRPLVILLMSDIRQTYAGLSETPPSSAPDRADHTVASQFKRKRKAEEPQIKKKSGLPPRYLKLKSKIKSLIRGLQDPKQEHHSEILDGIHTAIKVITMAIMTGSVTAPCDKKFLPENMSTMSSWLPQDLIGNVLETCKLTLQFSHHWQPDKVNANLLSIIRTIVALLHTQDWTELEDSMCWMLSLPWLQNDPSWIDLKPTDSKAITKISQEISEKINMEVKCECLQGLSLLPKDVSPQWRVHVYRQACTDSDKELKIAAISCLPLLLVHLGPNANHLVHDLLLPMVNTTDHAIQESLVSIAGILACVICRKAVFRKETNQYGVVEHQHRIQCLSCDSLIDKNECALSKERPKLVDPNMFLPFLGLITNGNTQVRLKLISCSLERIFGHIGVRSNNSATISMLKSCLSLIQDPDFSVREQFSKVIGSMVGEGNGDSNQLIVRTLKETLESARLQGNVRLQQTVILTIAQIGRVAEDELLQVVIISLLENMLSKVQLIAAIAYQQLNSVVKYKKTKTQNLFLNSRQQICKFLVTSMLNSQKNNVGRSADEILRDVSDVLDFRDCKAFLKAAGKCMIPQLVSAASPEASSLIKMIATILDLPSRMKLLLEYIKYVFAYLVCFCQRSEMERAILYLQNETDLELAQLLRMNFQVVHQELLLYLSTHYSQVFNGLRHLSTYDHNYTGPKDIKTSEEMANYLQPRLLGVIAFFDSQLLNASIPLSDKRLTMESLTAIIKLMGKKHIGTIRHKVVGTLRIGLQFTDREFIEINCRAWNCFVKSLEMSFLGQMMSQIIATILPLLEDLPKQIAEIINFIIVDNRAALKDRFHEIYFLPDIPELKDANTVLKKYTQDGPSSQSDFETKLKHTIKGVQHESTDIRIHALSQLRTLLQQEKDVLYDHIIGNETADPIISQLVSVLLKSCRDSNVKAQSLIAECIGELGAVDPGRLELLTNNPKEARARFPSSIEDDSFAVGLINEVVKAFLAAPESRIQDCAAYALQELLKIYHISEPSDGDAPSGQLWGRFPEHVQQILVPLLSSKYIVSKKTDFSQLTKPIYCSSEKTQRFQDWANIWTSYLSSKVKNEKAYEVFRACGALIKHVVGVALYILPYVVMQVVVGGSPEDINEISEEIKEVLNQTRKTDNKNRPISNSHHLSAQTVFSVLDYLVKWKRFQAQRAPVSNPGKGKPSYLTEPQYVAVTRFLELIPQNLLADACHACRAYTRALMHLEHFLSSKGQNLQDHLDFMQKLYGDMDEPDGVYGVASIRQAQPTIMEEILAHESLGHHHDSQACYEKAIQSEADDVTYHQGLLKSLLEIGQETQALLHATGAITERPDWGPQLSSYMVEAAWKLGDWQKLETFLESNKSTRSWPVGIGKVLIGAKNKREEQFFEQLRVVRCEQIGPLSAASMESGSYLRGYEYIVRLHMLNEIEESCRCLLGIRNSENEAERMSTAEQLLKQWSTRFETVQCSFRTQEPLLTLRRTLFTLVQRLTNLDLDQEIGRWWLSSARIARKAGYLQTAYSFLLQAAEYNLPEFILEKAKYLRVKGELDQALRYLERGIESTFGSKEQLMADTSESGFIKRRTYSQALLLQSRFSEETSCLESNEILKLYRKVISVNHDWEDGHFYMGKYYDKIITTLLEDRQERPNPSKQWEVVVFVVKHFWQSLRYGNQYIYQSLPRLLSLWLDYGASVVEAEKKERARQTQGAPQSQKLTNMKKSLSDLNENISKMGRMLAPYQLFTAFSQLISRICHVEPEVFQKLKDLIARIFVSFPQQSIWMMMAISKSSYPVRKQRCQDIFATVKLIDPDQNKFINHATKLTERLLELCEKEILGTHALSITNHFRPLKRLLEDKDFGPILLPLQSAMRVTLPSTPGNHVDHNPFPTEPVFLQSFEETIEVLPSLQRPKKITMNGSDGKLYTMLCKPKDDLRKDCRLMEFNALVNKFLSKDPEARKRDLHIRTYSVVPLNEYCGLLEWVNNTLGLRHILIRMYKERGIYYTGKELQSMTPKLEAPLEIKRRVFKEKFLNKHPPIFKEWFLQTFPDPTSWYNARLAYARTSAVMCMVGYILGLGDRHGENILFDSTSGDCIHVDFNCLFNRGETFDWPEKVPFRLTQNLVDALGPLGVEGIFRRSCEVTLRVMRDQMDPLMSVLRTFIHDPLVEWRKKSKNQKMNPADTELALGEIHNDQALVHVQNIESRLKGIRRGTMLKPRSVALSVEGHVNYLLQEATSIDNLCQMYVGWAAYL
uniref:Serine/threonine-protein kinase ATR n=1 Tax=Crassostrea virginica TaxID=6565 RepID=A0A8B8DXC1_CRAVI|nr:serine/threonine-protein kinase ATR-like isoform X2 [Crassostrea virginica]